MISLHKRPFTLGYKGHRFQHSSGPFNDVQLTCSTIWEYSTICSWINIKSYILLHFLGESTHAPCWAQYQRRCYKTENTKNRIIYLAAKPQLITLMINEWIIHDSDIFFVKMGWWDRIRNKILFVLSNITIEPLVFFVSFSAALDNITNEQLKE